MSEEKEPYQPRFVPVPYAYAFYLHPYRRVSTIYRVIVPLKCTGCGNMMQVNDTLTLHRPDKKPARSGTRLQPYCIKCYPLEFVER